MPELTQYPNGDEIQVINRVLIRPHFNLSSETTEFHLRRPAADSLALAYAGIPTPNVTEEDIISALTSHLIPVFNGLQERYRRVAKANSGDTTEQWDEKDWQQAAVSATRRAVASTPMTKRGVRLDVTVVRSEEDEVWKQGTDFVNNIPRVDAHFCVEPNASMWLAVTYRPSTMDLSRPSTDGGARSAQERNSSALSRKILWRVAGEHLPLECNVTGGTLEDQVASLRANVPTVLKQRLLDCFTKDNRALAEASMFVCDITGQDAPMCWDAAMDLFCETAPSDS